MKQKLYIVKREVLAHSLKQAMTARGHIFAIELADDKYQPDFQNPPTTGFKPTV